MFQKIIKAYESKKCTRVLLKKEGGFFSSTIFYELKIFTTLPRQTVPQDEETLKKISEAVLKKEWNKVSNNKLGYTHSTALKEYPGLSLLIKKTKEEKKDNGTEQ